MAKTVMLPLGMAHRTDVNELHDQMVEWAKEHDMNLTQAVRRACRLLLLSEED